MNISHKDTKAQKINMLRLCAFAPWWQEQKMKKAFTLIELVVAIGLLAMVMSFASVIFRVSINSHRTAIANAEIMQNLRAIIEQLNADFKGIIPGYGGYIAFNTEKRNIGGETIEINSDCLAFFANGDFQSSRQYEGRTMAGNAACIFYGPADSNSFGLFPESKERVLIRRQTILTAEAPSQDSDARGEYYNKSLSEWRVTPPFADPEDWVERPFIDPNNLSEHFVMHLAKGVDNFTIQFAEQDSLGNIKWARKEQGEGASISTNAFKFTFTLYDSKGVIKKGRTFTHIVCLD